MVSDVTVLAYVARDNAALYSTVLYLLVAFIIIAKLPGQLYGFYQYNCIAETP